MLVAWQPRAGGKTGSCRGGCSQTYQRSFDVESILVTPSHPGRILSNSTTVTLGNLNPQDPRIAKLFTDKFLASA